MRRVRRVCWEIFLDFSGRCGDRHGHYRHSFMYLKLSDAIDTPDSAYMQQGFALATLATMRQVISSCKRFR